VEEEGGGEGRRADKKTTKPNDETQERTRDRQTEKERKTLSERKKEGETGVEIFNFLFSNLRVFIEE